MANVERLFMVIGDAVYEYEGAAWIEGCTECMLKDQCDGSLKKGTKISKYCYYVRRHMPTGKHGRWRWKKISG